MTYEEKVLGIDRNFLVFFSSFRFGPCVELRIMLSPSCVSKKIPITYIPSFAAEWFDHRRSLAFHCFNTRRPRLKSNVKAQFKPSISLAPPSGTAGHCSPTHQFKKESILSGRGPPIPSPASQPNPREENAQ